MKKILLFCLFVFSNMSLIFAQNNSDVEMADLLRSSGKIYVVISVLLIILAGIFVYLFSIDKKIGKLENEIKKKN